MTTYNNEATAAPNAKDFLGGNYLKKEDISEPVVVTVTNVWSESILNAGRKKLVVSFKEFEKPLILNKTNIRRLARIFKTGDTTAWRGPVTVYVEQGVEYAGRIVGGIRLKPAMSVSTSEDAPIPKGQINGHGHSHAPLEESDSDTF